MAGQKRFPEFGLRGAAAKLVRSLKASGSSIALAESCTGGLMSKALTDIPGASEVFWGGLIVYSDRAKEILARVDPKIIADAGAVSEETVRALLSGILEISGCDLACAVSGIAGPGGGSPEKPVGTVWIGAARKDGRAIIRKIGFKGNRDSVRKSSAIKAFAMVHEV